MPDARFERETYWVPGADGMAKKLYRFAAILLLPMTSLCQAEKTQGPPDKPVSANEKSLKKYEDAIAPYVKKAKQTLPRAKRRFLKGLPEKEKFFVTIKLFSKDGKYEQVFVLVEKWEGQKIEGILSSDVALIPDFKKGDKLTCNEADVLDWTISKPDGSEEGNYVGKFLDTYKP